MCAIEIEEDEEAWSKDEFQEKLTALFEICKGQFDDCTTTMTEAAICKDETTIGASQATELDTMSESSSKSATSLTAKEIEECVLETVMTLNAI